MHVIIIIIIITFAITVRHLPCGAEDVGDCVQAAVGPQGHNPGKDNMASYPVLSR